ncbi:MAG: cellulase family glycosylhydrolase [Candidatus Promineifilaceae bacterium]
MNNRILIWGPIVVLLACLLSGCLDRDGELPTPTPTIESLSAVVSTATPRPAATTTIVALPTETAVSPISPTVTETPSPTPTPSATPTPDYPIYSGPPLDRNQIGIQVHLHREDIPGIFDHLQALHMGWVKVQVSWKLYQPEPDRLDEVLFAELDELVAKAAENNIKVLLSVAKAPEWSRPTTELDGPPIDYDHYRAFMALLAARYTGRVAAYELWNEANLQREWNGVSLNAADLVALIRAGATGVRSVDGTAVLISGAPSPTGINDGITAVDDRQYFREMVAAGVLDVVDAVGAHPYGWANPPDATAANPDSAATSHNNHPSFFFLDTLQDYHAILEGAGRPETPIWVTEFGWGSFDRLEAPPPAGVEFMNDVSEWQQAVYILRAYEIGQSLEWVGPMFLWNLNFGPTLGPDFIETGFSVLRPDGSRRPVYEALTTLLVR